MSPTSRMEELELSPIPADRFAAVLEPARYRSFEQALSRGGEALRGRTLWHMNSTAEGGGVAELLRFVLAYLAGSGIRTRWLVIDGDDEFFELTKRVHHFLHGEPGDGGELGEAERGVYEETIRRNVEALDGVVSEGDVVVLHDPQTVGMAPALARRGARVIWSCHVGVDEPNAIARSAWSFLRPYVEETDAHVFSRRAYVWEGLRPENVQVVPPCIDAFSPKNQLLDETAVLAILRTCGVVPDAADGAEPPVFARQDGTRATVSGSVEMIESRPVPASARLVTQVSRWDRLKDPIGVLRGFAEHVDARTPTHLVLAGPSPGSVSDDPEAEEVLTEVEDAWRALPDRHRDRIHLACLPMEDVEENAAIVNALQRRADIVVQKSLAEGFGLTVAEAMWKERAVLGSRVGGIQDQIVDGESGVLVDDPEDLVEFGRALGALVDDPETSALLGRRAHRRVSEEFLAPRYLARYLELIERITRGSGAKA